QRNLTYPRGLALYENYLIICDDELKIFDTTNPAEPVLVKSVNYKFKDIVVYNDIMYAFGEQKVTQFKWNSGDFLDRKSTRLNSSHVKISYAVFCLKKK